MVGDVIRTRFPTPDLYGDNHMKCVPGEENTHILLE